jgi:ribonuclease-3
MNAREFKNPALLETALTHKSYVNEAGGTHNERLEFLGDAILGFIAAEHLYGQNPKMSEGDLSRLRAGYVCEKSLAGVAKRLGLGEKIRMGRGERADGGGTRDSILSDAFEAVIAAVYLDGGIERCKKIVLEEVLSRPPEGHVRDAKSRLQEFLQARGKPAPEYRLTGESGPDHRKNFVIEARIDGCAVSFGEGRSKKEAEMIAAEKALMCLRT